MSPLSAATTTYGCVATTLKDGWKQGGVRTYEIAPCSAPLTSPSAPSSSPPSRPLPSGTSEYTSASSGMLIS